MKFGTYDSHIADTLTKTRKYRVQSFSYLKNSLCFHKVNNLFSFSFLVWTTLKLPEGVEISNNFKVVQKVERFKRNSQLLLNLSLEFSFKKFN